jgi:hypothetical protein
MTHDEKGPTMQQQGLTHAPCPQLNDTPMLTVDACPCGEAFVSEIQRMRRERCLIAGADDRAESESWTWIVTCAAGHAFDVEGTANISPRWTLAPQSPIQRTRGTPMTTREDRES